MQHIRLLQPARIELAGFERIGDTALCHERALAPLLDEGRQPAAAAVVAEGMDPNTIGAQGGEQAARPEVVAEAGDERRRTTDERERRRGVGSRAAAAEGQRSGHVGATLDRSLRSDDHVEQEIAQRDELRL